MTMTKDEAVERLIESAIEFKKLKYRNDIFIKTYLKSGGTVEDSDDIVSRHYDKERELFANIDELIEADERHKLNDKDIIQEERSLRECWEELEK